MKSFSLEPDCYWIYRYWLEPGNIFRLYSSNPVDENLPFIGVSEDSIWVIFHIFRTWEQAEVYKFGNVFYRKGMKQIERFVRASLL
jgi:hypothetical protein